MRGGGGAGARDDREITRVAIAELSGGEGERAEEFDLPAGEPEFTRQNALDDDGGIFELERFSEDGGIASEAALPEAPD